MSKLINYPYYSYVSASSNITLQIFPEKNDKNLNKINYS